MDVETFREALESGQIHLECQHCGALHWVNVVDNQPHLMRAGEIHHEECPICSEIHEMVS